MEEKQFDRFYECLEDLSGYFIPVDLKTNYRYNSDYIIEIQDWIGTNCALAYLKNYPTLLIVEMAELYAKAELGNY